MNHTRQPVVTYTPAGAARQPGFYNPDNPFDTGRAGETNRELNGGLGGRVAWWDYDRGAPMSGITLGDDGLYRGAGSGGAGGGGRFLLGSLPIPGPSPLLGYPGFSSPIGLALVAAARAAQVPAQAETAAFPQPVPDDAATAYRPYVDLAQLLRVALRGRLRPA